MQDALRILSDYWTDRGCLVAQPFNTEVGAGTMNPATILRVLGPEPWRVAYVEPSVRPDDSRYGENPNRLQTHTQFQVILKPDPGDPQEQYLGSLEALGIDLVAHDVRFVEDNWAQPAIGAWGLGWEVWLDGMEITQFTYFQQVGGLNLDPVAVELTYGMERILMAVQGVTHFKDIAYAPGVSYGEAFGQAEYEMSRYYLDEADVPTNRALFEAYTAEAARLIEARLPVPAHTYVLKSSHAFNVLDSRGAISTTERARAFATMRRLAKDVCTLWVARREELGYPLGLAEAPTPASPEPVPAQLPTTPQSLAIEIGVEELPPHVVSDTIEQVRAAVTAKLEASTLPHGAITVDGTPRRIVVQVEAVAPAEPGGQRLNKGPKWSAAFDAEGQPTKALEGFLRGQKAQLADVVKAEIGGNEHAAVAVEFTGRPVLEVAAALVADLVTGLRAEKNMRWSDPQLSFSRAIRWLVALWGPVVVPVTVSDLTAGRTTYLLREDPAPHVAVASADQLIPTLQARIQLFTADRRDRVIEQAHALAAGVGGLVDVEGEAALIDEITNLVEAPHGVLGSFEQRYLELPEQILTTVMRKHQRYLPVRDVSGQLMPYFVTMANGECDDALVRRGNESVLRARYEDAAFFYQADLTVPLADFRAALSELTFEDRLGSVAQRAERIRDLAHDLTSRCQLDETELATLTRAGELAKFDLSTQMVVELSSLAGFMAREYALRAGETPAVGQALFEMEQPRTTSDDLPRSTPGMVLALADRFDLLASLFAIGAKPSGSSDQFGLRRAALGIIRILRNLGDLQGEAPTLTLSSGLGAAVSRLREQGVDAPWEVADHAHKFVLGRFAQLVKEERRGIDYFSTVAPVADSPWYASSLLRELEALQHSESLRRLVEALVRIDRILPDDVVPWLPPGLVEGSAEAQLVDAITNTPTGSRLTTLAEDKSGLADAVNRYFDEILVLDADPSIRARNLGLLAAVVERTRLGLDWGAVEKVLSQVNHSFREA